MKRKLSPGLPTCCTVARRSGRATRWLSTLWFATLVVLTSYVVGGCNRSSNSQPTPSATSSLTRSATAKPEGQRPSPGAAASAAPKKRCIVETPSEPPPAREPAADCPKDPTGPFDLPRVQVAFIDAPTAPVVQAEHATTNAERQRGLMYRQKLAENAGMLFTWERERPRSFWMKNTCLPLDMLFIAADGTIVGILEQVPPMNLASRRIPCHAMHVLEMNAGWSRSAGVKAGQRVEIQP